MFVVDFIHTIAEASSTSFNLHRQFLADAKSFELERLLILTLTECDSKKQTKLVKFLKPYSELIKIYKNSIMTKNKK